jgi:hypothetical protein
MPQNSSVGSGRKPTLTVNVERGLPKLDLGARTCMLKQQGIGNGDSPKLPLADVRRTMSPEVKETESKSELDDAKSKGNLNSNNLPQMLHPEVNADDVARVKDGCHTVSMGHNHRAIGPTRKTGQAQA